MTERVCFQLRVRPDRIEEYRARHEEVWPDMLRALRDTGWRNYSLFLREDGLLIGYFETDHPERTMAAMDATEVNERWQRDMAQFFDTDGDAEGGTLLRYTEVFHLEDQLAVLPDGSDSRER